ncbi:MAG: AraC family transcriptional regulator [Myxococcales bacterium]|nr:AraC family transcriptional regulator [Myxococcales bacterium]
MRTELIFPTPDKPRWREQLATLEDSARNLEEMLTESLEQEDVVRAVARLSVPELADHCAVFVVEGDKCVRRAFSHRDPEKTAAVETLLDQGVELYEFAEGRRALAGESLVFQFAGATARQPALDTPVMSEIVRCLAPTSVLLVPFVVLGTTIAVASFNRTAESGLTQGPKDLALAREMARRALVRHAGFRAPRFTASEDSRLRRVDRFIRENLGSPISLQAIAREAGLSRFHVLRLFKHAYGETPFKRLTRLRMEDAQRRLARTNVSVTEIASTCGYDNSAHFASAFRRVFGVSPTAFRRMAR